MDKHTLPSGQAVSALVTADPNRPWEAHYTAGVYLVRRQRRGDSSEYEIFHGGRTASMLLSKPDADALVAILNARAGAKGRGRRSLAGEAAHRFPSPPLRQQLEET